MKHKKRYYHCWKNLWKIPTMRRPFWSMQGHILKMQIYKLLSLLSPASLLYQESVFKNGRLGSMILLENSWRLEIESQRNMAHLLEISSILEWKINRFFVKIVQITKSNCLHHKISPKCKNKFPHLSISNWNKINRKWKSKILPPSMRHKCKATKKRRES